MRETYRQELHDVYDDAAGIFDDVALCVRKAVASLVQGDTVAAEEIIEGDFDFNRRTIELEEKVLQITAMQSPVARDVRLLQSLVYISMHLERMADLCANVAKTTIRAANKDTSQSMLDLIQAQGNLVSRVLDTTIEAMKTGDIELAAKLPELDEPIDELYKQFFREVARHEKKKEIKWASQMVLASRYLERIADHSIDIGERLVFLITGERSTLEEVAVELEEERMDRSDGPEDIDDSRVGAL